MNICLDARSPGTGGVLTYINNFLETLFALDKSNHYYLITDKQHNQWRADNVEQIIVPTSNPLGWLAWSNLVLPGILKGKNIEVYHALKHVTVFNIPAKKVLTFHGAEMIYEYPEWYKKHDLIYWRSMYTLAGKKYQAITTATQAEADFFRQKKSLPASKFRVIPFAANSKFKKIEDKTLLTKERKRLKLPERFVLTVTRFHPIKNIKNQILAFAEARKTLSQLSQQPSQDIHFVIVGANEGPYYEELKSIVAESNLTDKVIFYGRVKEDLVTVYNLATLFLFPSFHENFGLVLLEAMGCGLPVISSRLASIEEAVGSSAILVDPENIEALSTELVGLLNDQSKLTTYTEKSLQQVKQFTWEKCVQQTLELYESL